MKKKTLITSGIGIVTVVVGGCCYLFRKRLKQCWEYCQAMRKEGLEEIYGKKEE